MLNRNRAATRDVPTVDSKLKTPSGGLATPSNGSAAAGGTSALRDQGGGSNGSPSGDIIAAPSNCQKCWGTFALSKPDTQSCSYNSCLSLVGPIDRNPERDRRRRSGLRGTQSDPISTSGRYMACVQHWAFMVAPKELCPLQATRTLGTPSDVSTSNDVPALSSRESWRARHAFHVPTATAYSGVAQALNL